MDWSKAKTILIIALVITDLLLIITYSGFSFKSDSFNDSKALSDFLAQKNIFVDEKLIPAKHSDMPVLYVHSEETDGGEINIAEALKGLFFITGGAGSDEEYKKIADGFLKAAGLDYSTAVFDRAERGEGYVWVKYKNVIQNITIEKSYIICTFKDGVLVDCDFFWLRVLKFQSSKQETISASQALLLFMTQVRNDVQNDIYVDSIEMVYWLDETVNVETPVLEDTAFPAWKIVYNGGLTKYIDAYEHRS